MSRAHNFNAGPAVLPLEVVKETADAILDFNGTGIGLMEMSHRSKEFGVVMDEAQHDLLTIMNLSADEYDVLFLGGGASMQFLMVPYNFLHKKADYINTGVWSKKAIKEGKFFGEVNVAATSEDTNFNYIPKSYNLSKDAEYVHITTNNTIYGTQWKSLPDTGDVTLVADMSSDFLGIVHDYSKFNLIYAGAQKNVGPSGATVIVVKKSWLESHGKKDLPTMMNYKTHTEKGSMFNTPPCVPVYAIGRTFKWILKHGGVAEIQKINEKKAKFIYDAIDAHPDFYKGAVKNVEDRSLMNITWNLNTPELEAKFIAEAKDQRMIGLKGHRSVGGIRASTYNACPMESAEALANFMEDFYKKNK